MAAADPVLLKSTLEISNKAFKVSLTASEIHWEAISTVIASGPYSEPLVKTENQSIKVNEVIAVRAERTTGKKNDCLEMEPLSPTSFSVFHIHRMAHKHRWRNRKVTFNCKDPSICQQWYEKLQQLLVKPELSRPKKLLVFVNPFGGKKRGPKLYQEKIAPLFQLAGITVDVIFTERANHARDEVLDGEIYKYDGLCAVGGDGMFAELLGGILTRTLREAGQGEIMPATKLIQPQMRIGIIPAGSTDTVSWSTQGYNDPVTAALHIILGDTIAMDVATVHHGNQFLKYCISLLGYGYYGDVISDSERKRWMGPSRYQFEGFKKFVGNKSYEGEISFLPSPDKESNPRDGIRCRTGCNVCRSAGDQRRNQIDAEAETSLNADITDRTDGNDLEVKEEERWQKIKGRFIAINSFSISCKSNLGPEGVAPACHLGDGYTDLVLVHDTSRLNYMKHLYRCIDKKADQFDFDFIQVFRVKEFKFRPLVDDSDESQETSEAQQDGRQKLRGRQTVNSLWNCDGEPLEQPSLDFRMHCQAVRLFGRGIEEENKDDTTTFCISCSKLKG